jgi:hypothetical protein
MEKTLLNGFIGFKVLPDVGNPKMWSGSSS